MDLAAMAEGSSGDALWRRAAVFADESGRAAWSPLATYLLAELRDFNTALAACLPSGAGADGFGCGHSCLAGGIYVVGGWVSSGWCVAASAHTEARHRVFERHAAIP